MEPLIPLEVLREATNREPRKASLREILERCSSKEIREFLGSRSKRIFFAPARSDTSFPARIRHLQSGRFKDFRISVSKSGLELSALHYHPLKECWHGRMYEDINIEEALKAFGYPYDDEQNRYCENKFRNELQALIDLT